VSNYFIFGFPCSGTAWLANFLTWGDSFCFHDIAQGVETLEEMEAAFARVNCSHVGTADTTGLLLIPKLRIKFPDAKYLFIVRDVPEVKIALATVGFDPDGVDQLGGYLSKAISDPTLNSATMGYDDILSSTMMKQVWDFLDMPGEFPFRRFELLRAMNIEDTARHDPTTKDASALLQSNISTFNRLIANTFPPVQPQEGSFNGIA
jgi:hypothetical protein